MKNNVIKIVRGIAWVILGFGIISSLYVIPQAIVLFQEGGVTGGVLLLLVYYIIPILVLLLLRTKKPLMETSSVPIPNQSPSSTELPRHKIPYLAVLLLSFVAAYFIVVYIGFGLELFFLLPGACIILLIMVLKMRQILRKNNAGWTATLLCLLVLCTGLLVARIATPILSDSPQPGYIIQSIAYNLFLETPDLSPNYSTQVSNLMGVTILYVLISLIFIARLTKKNNGAAGWVLSTFIPLASVLLIAWSLLPLTSAWAKYKLPSHAQKAADIEFQNTAANYETSASIVELSGSSIFGDTHSYVGVCAENSGKNNPYIIFFPNSTVTCRESPTSYVAYTFISQKYGYSCSDPSGDYIVPQEPIELTCNNAPQGPAESVTNFAGVMSTSTTDFIYPTNGEDLALGKNQLIEWVGPANVSYVLAVEDLRGNALGAIATVQPNDKGGNPEYTWIVGDYTTFSGNVTKVLSPGNYQLEVVSEKNNSQYIQQSGSFTIK